MSNQEKIFLALCKAWTKLPDEQKVLITLPEVWRVAQTNQLWLIEEEDQDEEFGDDEDEAGSDKEEGEVNITPSHEVALGSKFFKSW